MSENILEQDSLKKTTGAPYQISLLPILRAEGGFRSYLQNMMDMANLHKDDISDVVGQFQTFVSATSQGETASKGTQSLAEYGNQSSTNVTQNVTITNEFHGDTAGQEKSATAMEKATDDMTGELARALNVT